MCRLICPGLLLALIPLTSFASGAQRFVVTEHDTSGFVVHRDVVAAQFIVSDRSCPSPLAPRVEPAAAISTKRPVVLFYSATWCVPCRIARQALERAQLPFEIQVIDVTQGGQPQYVDSIPYFEWDAPGGRRFAKWTTVDDLIQRWRLTQAVTSNRRL